MASLTQFKVGDEIGFKGDYEQSGTVLEIHRTRTWDGRPARALTVEVSYDYHDHDLPPYWSQKHGCYTVRLNGDYATWKVG